jgi:hypothetical protein
MRPWEGGTGPGARRRTLPPISATGTALNPSTARRNIRNRARSLSASRPTV